MLVLLTGIIGGFHWGLGFGTGIAASGLIINSVGVANTYFIYSMTSIFVLALLLFTHLLVKPRERKEDADEASYKLVPTNTQDDEHDEID